MKYRHTSDDFSVDLVPIPPGRLERVLRNNGAFIGSLFEYMVPTLYNTAGVRAGKFWFTLVNVTCTHTNFTYGLAEPPPVKARPVGCTWLFTFSLRDSGYSSTTEVKHLTRHPNATVWGRNVGEFMTIGVMHYPSRLLNLEYNLFAPEWLYYLVGIVTKGFLIRGKFHTVDDDYSKFYKGKNLSMLYSQYHMMPMATALRNIPYPYLVFNRQCWGLGSLLLSPKHITAESLLYFCLYVKNVQPLSPEVESVVVDKFHESLTDLAQRRDSNEPATELSQVLYAALTLRGKLPTKDTFNWLVEQEPSIALPTGNYTSNIKTLIY